MIGWLVAFALIVGIAVLPVGVQASYDSSGVKLKLTTGPFRFTLYPGKRKRRKEKKDEFEGLAKKTGKTGGNVLDFLSIVQIILEFLSTFSKKMVVKSLQLKLILGGGDPCDLAIHYGRGWATLGSLVPLLETVFVIKKRDLEVECDFCANNTTVMASVDIRITFARLLTIAVRYGLRAIKEYLKIMNKRKGGAVV